MFHAFFFISVLSTDFTWPPLQKTQTIPLRASKWHDQIKYFTLTKEYLFKFDAKHGSSETLSVHKNRKINKVSEKNTELFSAQQPHSQRKESCMPNNNKRWIIPPWRKISVKSVFIAEPWTNSNLIRGANLFRSQKCIGFNFTLHAFRYQQEGVKREGTRRETKRKGENIWSLIFCQKSPYQRELKSILLQTKEGARGK